VFETILQAASGLASLEVAALIVAGVVIGVVGGALPGISSSVTLALLLPFSFALEPLHGLVLLASIYMAAEYGGSISAILINTPGTPAAICTALDGHPMAKQGRVMEALYASIIGSSMGGFLGVLVLLFFTPPLAEFSLRFGSPEIFWLAIAGLAIVCNLAADNFIKGVIAACIGLALAVVGEDLETGEVRFVFDVVELEDGIKLVPAVLGLFAVSQMLMIVGNAGATAIDVTKSPGAFRRMLHFFFVRPVSILRSSAIGVVIGILPGAGASIASFVSYGEAKRFSKQPEQFGKGNPEGVFAAETANNAMVGGSLVPLLAFGIPGSASAAVLFGGLTIHGMLPGPRLFTDHATVTFGFILSFFPVVLVMLTVGTVAARWFSKIVDVKLAYIVPTVMTLAIIGSYSFAGSLVDVFVTMGTGVLGYLLIRFGFGLGPVVLGFILGPMAEDGLRRSIVLAETQESFWGYLFGRPISIILIFITLSMIATAYISETRRRKRMRAAAETNSG